ncbi:MAG: NAD-dependent epimerase/dehydratase family protein [Candidatus Aenigmarchaeota archaeon]|nr:NAD-dependent epimerase/dehydratase family protein [Candidatus Aenigmarchaeota archaeon]
MILVTGGAGFIGSHLVKKLQKGGNHVRVLDNLCSGKKENVSGVDFVVGDVKSEIDVSKVVKGCEYVFHLAALTDARDMGDDVFKVNFLGSKNVFAAAERHGAKVIFASSAAVYGEGTATEDSPLKPLNDYGKSKAKAEKLLKSGFIARLFNVYGPAGKSVINRFVKGICAGNGNITIYGSGLQTRDYVYVDDVVDALMLGMNSEGIYNVGTGSETSLLNLVTMIERSCGAGTSIKFEDAKNEIQRSKAIITKIKAIGWSPKVALEEGIRRISSASSGRSA